MNASLPSFRLLLLLGLSVLIVSGLGAGWLLSTTGPADQAAVKAAPPLAPTSARAQAVVCFGQVDVEHGCTPLTPLTPGRVVEVCVGEGDAVKAGQALVKLDDAMARARADEAQAAVDAAEALLAKARQTPTQHALELTAQQDAVQVAASRATAARLALEQKQEMRHSGLLSPHEIAIAEEIVRQAESLLTAEQKRTEQLRLQDPEPEVRRAEADVAAAKARLRQAQKGLDECILRAPADGSVVRVQTTVGDVPGLPGKPSAVVFAADEPRVVRAEVEPEVAARVAAGQKVRVEDGDAGLALNGRVLRVADRSPRRRTAECVIGLDPDQSSPRVGQRVRVVIKAGD